jgi:hypothetical protein
MRKRETEREMHRHNFDDDEYGDKNSEVVLKDGDGLTVFLSLFIITAGLKTDMQTTNTHPTDIGDAGRRSYSHSLNAVLLSV